jgi:hypothetical protein
MQRIVRSLIARMDAPGATLNIGVGPNLDPINKRDGGQSHLTTSALLIVQPATLRHAPGAA